MSNLAKRVQLEDQKRRAIVHEAGPTHPQFGEAFMRYYLSHYCVCDCPKPKPVGGGCRWCGKWVAAADWHPEFWQQAFGSLGQGSYHVWEAFRGSAKSTSATLGVPLAALALGLKQYVWIVQDETKQARQSMENILNETESNPRILADFPHLVPALGRHNRPIADRDDDVVFASGQRLQALGAGQKLRGRRHRQHRPDLCVVDDLENDTHVLTKYQREKLDRWFSSALIPALAPSAELHFLGTPLHHDSLLRRLQKRGGFRSRRYPAVTGDADVCPTCEDDPLRRVDPRTEEFCPTCHGAGRLYDVTWGYRGQEYLGAMRERMGLSAFTREMLLIVTDEERKRFPRRLFLYDDRPDADGTRCRIGVDVGLGQKEEHDRSAVVVTMRRPGERRYHVDHAWAGRKRGKALLETVKAVYADYKQLGYTPIVNFESTQAQVWGTQELEDVGIPVEPVKPNKDKVIRAEPASVHYENARVTHAHKLKDSDFEDELDQFPDGEHEDYVDALAHGFLDLEGESHGGVAGAVSHNRKNRQKADTENPRFSDD